MNATGIRSMRLMAITRHMGLYPHDPYFKYMEWIMTKYGCTKITAESYMKIIISRIESKKDAQRFMP